MSESATTKAAPAKAATPDEIIARQRNKQVTILSGVIIALAALVMLSRLTQSAETPLREVLLIGGTTEAPAFKASDVIKLRITKPGVSPLEITRDGEGWRFVAFHNAAAETATVDRLLEKITSATRMNRPAVTEATKFPLYRLADDEAVGLELEGTSGLLLHLKLGLDEAQTYDLVRIIGPQAEDGIFEVKGMGGSFDTLYSALLLDTQGRPDRRRWLDFSGFQPVPENADVMRVTLQESARKTELVRAEGSMISDDKWTMTSPRRAKANDANVRSLIDVLSNMKPVDIAGRASEAAKFGLDQPAQTLSLAVSVQGKEQTVVLQFGAQEGENVACRVKDDPQGLVYWVNEYSRGRFFRPVQDYTELTPLNAIASFRGLQTVDVDQDGIRYTFTNANPDGAANWSMTSPNAQPVDQSQLNALLGGIGNLQGSADTGTPDRTALQLGEGVSTRAIRVTVVQPRAGGTPGDDPPAEGIKVQVTALYFGTTVNQEVPVLLVADGRETVFWVSETRVQRLFPDPQDYAVIAPFECKVRHILISWKGRSAGIELRDPNRTEQQANELADKVLALAQQPDADFVALQREYNEDSAEQREAEYDVTESESLVRPFIRLASQLKPGEVGKVLTDYGWHIMKRLD